MLLLLLLLLLLMPFRTPGIIGSNSEQRLVREPCQRFSSSLLHSRVIATWRTRMSANGRQRWLRFRFPHPGRWHPISACGRSAYALNTLSVDRTAAISS